MTVLDSSAIIDYPGGVEPVIDYLDGWEPFFTSTLCVYEVVDGTLGSGSTDVMAVRRDFGRVQALDLTEGIALDAAWLRDRAMSNGVRLSTPDALIAVTARSTGDELVVADADFEPDVLEASLPVMNLRA